MLIAKNSELRNAFKKKPIIINQFIFFSNILSVKEITVLHINKTITLQFFVFNNGNSSNINIFRDIVFIKSKILSRNATENQAYKNQ